ncbi:23S rRNA (adenine(2503)-C(2))-methyltransferase RlmN [Candidatus Marinamargulisbacteria bacterium SCGC AG-333-B06]|nr:23S rRNA (adenine(2503)-C(2))-methyltransferase RlmN [Candidatus Marinamargulisbacteria bacterium SCGC AG-333-B06]
MKKEKQSIYDIDAAELKDRCKELGMPGYIADQVLDWLYKKHQLQLDKMKNIAKKNQEILAKNFDFNLFKSVNTITSSEENAIKNSCVLEDGNFLECVILKEKNYNTLCVSSQCGCPVDCKFCLTGVVGFKRQLTTAEIVKQIVYAFSMNQPITNIVFMGMGEPLLNAKPVFKAIDMLTHPKLYNISNRHITVSTSGFVKGIEYLMKNNRVVNLAFSVGSADPIKRERLMPVEKRNPIIEFAKILKEYQSQHNRKLTLEYTLLAGVNDTDYDIKCLINLAKYLNAKINLINLNPHKKIPYKPVSITRIHAIQKTIKKQQCAVTIRYKKGQDITAACGQLGESYLT